MSHNGLEVVSSQRADELEKIYNPIPSQTRQPYHENYNHVKPAAWNSQREVPAHGTQKTSDHRHKYVGVVVAALIGFLIGGAALGG